MKNVIYCSYYTVNTPYETEIRDLMSSLITFGLDHRIEGIDSRGSWTKNCAYKPEFIRKTLQEEGRPVVFLDADAVVVAPPRLFPSLECDVAYYLRNNAELLSGTLYFGFSTRANILLGAWEQACKLSPDVWDQKLLQETIDRFNNDSFLGLSQTILPEAYCHIFDAQGKDEPVIQHNQASRRFKDQVNGASHG